MAKKLRDEDLILNIVVNGDRGKKEIGELERAVKDTNAELRALEREEKKLRRSGKQNTEQYKAVTDAIKQKNNALNIAESRLKVLRSQIDVNKMSLVDLRREMNRVRRLRDLAAPHTEQWRKHDERLKEVTTRYQELDGRARATGSSLQRMAGRFNHYIGVLTAGFATMFAAVSGIRKTINDFAEFDDKLADVMKTTNMTKEEVRELNEELKKIDTRTSQNDLLGLSRVAGKLGIQGKEDILGFVRASDQIGVALSEDLGGDVEAAITQVGKLVDIFKIDEDVPLEEALLKVGSAINELGMASTANEGYIVEFTRRMAGVGPLANVSINDLMGMAATLDSLGQTSEVSTTALSKLFLEMAKNSDVFAKYASMDASGFRELLNSDANEAFLRVLEGVKNNADGLTNLADTLGDLGQDGGRVIGVLGSLANNTGKLRQQQELSNQAFERGTSLTEEFGIKNETAQAQLEKARKGLQNMVVELGEKLMPVMTVSTNGFTYFVRILTVLFDFIQDNWKLITTLTAAIVGYNAAIFITNSRMQAFTLLAKLKVFWDNAMRASALLAAAAQALFTGNIGRASAAMRVFNLVVRANPLGILVSVLAAVGVAVYQYSKNLTAAERAQKALNKVSEDARESIVDEKIKMERLLAVARDKTQSDENRQKAIKALNDLSPKYLGALDLETIQTEKATKAAENYIKALLKEAKVKAANRRLEEIAQERQDLVKNASDIPFFSMDNVKAAIVGRGNVIASRVAEEAKALKAEEEALTKILKENADDIVATITGNAPGTSTPGPNSGESSSTSPSSSSSSSQNDKLANELQKQAEYRQKVLEGQMSLIEQERLAYQKRLQEAGIFGKQREDMTKEEIRVKEALEKEHYANLNQLDADALKTSIEQKQTAFNQELQELRIAHNEQYKEIKSLEEARAFLRDDLSAEALAGLRNMRQAQQEIDKKFRREEEALVKAHLQDLQSELRAVLETGQWEGLDLSDRILSDEERETINARLAEVRQQLSELGLGTGTEIAEDRGMRRSNVDVLGFTPDDWETFFSNLRQGAVSMDGLLMATQSLGQVWSQYNAMRTAGEQRELQQFEMANQQKEAALKKRLENGVITQEQYNQQVDRLNAELDKKRAVYERNRAKRERNVALMSAIVNTAAGVAKSLPNLVLAAAVGLMGGLQIATIKKEPLPEIPGAEKGGYANVVRKQDKRMFRSRGFAGPGYVDDPRILVAESGREFVASNEAYENPTIRPVLDAIDTAQKNGTISSINLEKVMARRMEMFNMPGRQKGGYATDQGSTPAPRPVTDNETKELIRQNNQLMSDLRSEIQKGIRAEVSLLGRRGFYEAEKDYKKIEQNINL
ncbi:phage tail tape measure protein [Cyclobacterium sp.]|uniref:phage tail tape measure protein n=1 Tax=Cyclobacterium sp. TaxID=1966343 RepID=UPI001994A4FD|nr:phage tail tape measure protein [Cyclobacterium sp.]MBD3630525.1 phage tail tape measure protein [Cyclobacterium sp.]